jgi:hypothetical protein
VGNEESEYPDPDSNRVMINMTNDLSDIYKEFLKEEIKNELFEILMEEPQEVKENIENELNIKTSQIKKLEKTQK